MGLLTKLKTTLRTEPPFDPGVFGAELAQKTEWTPIAKSAANCCVYRLRQDPMDQSLRFEMTLAAWFIVWFFYLFGLALFGLGIILIIDARSKGASIMLPVMGGVMIALGVVIHCSFKKKIVFCRERKAFFKLFGSIHRVIDPTRLAGYTPFREIGALQLLERRVRTKNGSYLCYELNLVRRDGFRVNVVAHGGYRQLAEDSAVLADFLKVPLWDVRAVKKEDAKS